MTVCKAIRGQKRDVCIGDMDRLITLKTRNITAPSDDEAPYYTEAFADLNNKCAWAMRKTVNGKTVFDGTNTERVISDEFYIRYDCTVTAEIWIDDSGNRFDIITTENIDGRNGFMKLNCIDRGVTSNYNNDI